MEFEVPRSAVDVRLHVQEGLEWLQLLKPQMKYWFECGYAKNLNCSSNPRIVTVHSNWYVEQFSDLMKVCKLCDGQLAITMRTIVQPGKHGPGWVHTVFILTGTQLRLHGVL